MRVFMTGAGGGMGFESFKAMVPDLGKLYDLVLLLRDSEKNRKLFAPYMDTKGLTIHWGDLLNREDVAAYMESRRQRATAIGRKSNKVKFAPEVYRGGKNNSGYTPGMKVV